MKKLFTKHLLLIFILFSHTIYADTEKTTTYKLSKYNNKNSPVLKVAKKKGTVGVIPYYFSHGRTYIFLGQELPGGKSEKAGRFSDFGGSMNPDGKTILDHALREFHEEVMGQMWLEPEYVLKNGYLMHKHNESGRDIYYIFVKFTPKQIEKTKKFDVATVRLKAFPPANVFLEKESFAWLSLDELIEQAQPQLPPPSFEEEETEIEEKPLITKPKKFSTHTPEGAPVKVLIRNFFLHDCLENQQLPELKKQFAH